MEILESLMPSCRTWSFFRPRKIWKQERLGLKRAMRASYSAAAALCSRRLWKVEEFEVDGHQHRSVGELYDLPVRGNRTLPGVELVNGGIANRFGPGASVVFGESLRPPFSRSPLPS